MEADSGYATPDRCAEKVMAPDLDGPGWHEESCGWLATRYDPENGDPLCARCEARRQGADDE